MATITTPTYLDGGTARTAGETMTINGATASLTTRTDTRIHANAPASMTGSIGSQTITEGELIWDAQNIRQVDFDSGTGNVPAIGTSVTQGGVSGYLLGVWVSKTVAPTAVGAAMPVSGFIKFREVTGGAFAAGALTGIGASATGADVLSWMEIAADAAATFTVPRLGKHTSRGGRFYIGVTDGTIGQQFQIPTNGSTVMFAPGAFVENSPGSADTDDDYTAWPALNGATNGWAHQHIGEAFGDTDKRQQFLKAITGGIMQMGEAHQQASTYASLAAQASTYVQISHVCTYTWADNKVTCYIVTGHFLETGQQTGLDFTSGGATSYNGIYTVTVISPYHFTVDLTGSGTTGNVTSRPGLTITFASHLLNIGEMVECDFTSGEGVDGMYEVYIAATTYAIKYPSIVAITAGNVSVLHSLTITFTAHNLAVGNKVYLDFTSGAGDDGQYTIKTVVDANNYQINFAHSAVIASSNVTMKRIIGHIAPAGCKVWIPNIIVAEVATTARTINTAPNGTITSRPEWVTTSAGAIDLEYLYCTSGYFNFFQAYSLRLKNCFVFDTVVITEIATAIDIEGLTVGMCAAFDIVTLNLSSTFAGGLIKRSKFQRGNVPGGSAHGIYIAYCKDITLDSVQGGVIQYTRSYGFAYYIGYSDNITLSNCRCLNGSAYTSVSKITVTDLDYCDRYNGRTNATAKQMSVCFGAGCDDCIVEGLTVGFSSTIPDCHPASCVVRIAASSNIKIRNIGTYSDPLSGGTWAPNAYGCDYILFSDGNSRNIKAQRCFLDRCRINPYVDNNADKGVLYEQVMGGMYFYYSKEILAVSHTALNAVIKGCQEVTSVYGQAAVYGTHFIDFFMATDYGRLLLCFNEPTTETTSQFTMVSGTAKFNSSGGLLMAVVGNQCIWEMPYFAKGHTGFDNVAAVMSGGTIGNYSLEFQADTGAGYSGSWLALNGTNLSALTVNPAVGFKFKIRITTTTTNTTAITYLRMDTTTTAAAQGADLYPLGIGVPVTVTAITDTGTPIPSAAVSLYAKDATGDLPYQETVTITNSGTTATVAHPAHGMSTDDKVLIDGASIDDNNGVHSIVVTSINQYIYLMGSSPGSNPTGTITSTWTALYGTTDANGQISMSRVFSVDQPVSGWARKSTSAPYYKTGPISGTIDTDLGVSLTALLLSDE
jgi:hypothetical protein